MRNNPANRELVARLTIEHREQTMTLQDKIDERLRLYQTRPAAFETDFADLVDTEKLYADGTLYDWGE
jgi:hypothetical protein